MSNAYLDLLAYLGIGGAHPGGFSLTKSILEVEKIQPNESVLDIGCGTGQTAAFIAERFNCQVIAIDNHPIMVDKARQRFYKNEATVKVIKGDIQNMDFVDNSFDLIIAESVIVFTDISKTLKELFRVLKSDGTLIMIEMTAEQYLPEEKQKKACSLYGINEILEKDEWILRLHQAGLTQVEMISTPSELIQSEINDINSSKNINMELFELWEEHNEFILHNRDFIGYRAFKCRKT
ncbi:methyltransferase domain-containing protein [Psychrobacillus sp. INOP01]|uniref:class I SAM-dependent methyltransferase n=1 Tax=Psychrobacillus sp. INOP01 TaxID=2829187 RepID=UPI001BAA9FC5|nr:class I SAM-dependent methyltransferase [Psychrobacillus sp. INOP01]QUG41762.1 methyltransferase domain-containing protein [Psychrobacillus sp. INOP01]